MASVPTRIRQSIRDKITSPTSALSVKFDSVSTTLGYPITFDPEWPILWSIFQQHYPDSGTFIPSVAAVVLAWCEAFVSWLERAENEESVEKLLDILKNVNRLELVLNTAKTGDQPRTRIDLQRSRFDLILPSSKPVRASGLEAIFASDFLDMFDETKRKSITTAAVVADEPDWADVSMNSPIIQQLDNRGAPQVESAESLPDITTIQRPEELLKKPPYWLIVRQEGQNRILIEASHGPSLSVLEGYLKKWCRGEAGRVDRPPVVEIKLKESPFGLGLLYDTLVLETGRGRELSATLVLAFVENVLGYVPRQVCGSVGSVWEFKRTRAFK